MRLIRYVDENDFTKKERALKKYFIKTYKHYIFDIIPKLKQSNKNDGIYEVVLSDDELMNKIYGKIILKFSVKNDIAILEDIEPSQFLIDCNNRELPIYKGFPYRNRKDLFKIRTVYLLGDD